MTATLRHNSTHSVDEVDAPDAIRLWHRLHGDRPDLLCVASAFHKAGKDGKGELVNWAERYFPPDQLDQAADWISTQDRNGRECYFAVAQLFAPRRLSDNAAPTRVVHADLDGSPLEACPIRPTIVVETSPGHYHAYWVLDRYLQPARAEDLNRRMARLIGADKAAIDAARLMRVPGTHSRKRGEWFDVHLLYVDDQDVRLDALEDALPPPEKTSQLATISAPALSDDDFTLIRQLGQQSPRLGRLYAGEEDHDSEADWGLAQELLRATGGDQERTYRLMRQSGLERPKWDQRRGTGDYLQYTIARAAQQPRSWPEHVAGESGPSNGHCSPHCERHLERIADLERELQEVRRREVRRAALVRNKGLRAPEKIVATWILNEQASRESRGLTGPIPITIEADPHTDWTDSTMCGSTGLSRSVATRALEHLTGDGGLWQKVSEPRISEDGKRYGSSVSLVPTAAVENLWAQAPTIQPELSSKVRLVSHPRVNPCPKHPMGVINIDTTYRCRVCGRDTQPRVRETFDPTDVVPPPIVDPHVTGEAVSQPVYQNIKPVVTPAPVPTVVTNAYQKVSPVLTDEYLVSLDRLYERAARPHHRDRRRRRSACVDARAYIREVLA